VSNLFIHTLGNRPLLVLVTVTTIACINPAHRDGQSIRCGEKAPVMQLEGIAAPSIGAACSGGMACADDPGVIARDHLATLTRGQGVVCTVTATGPKTSSARCMMEGIDLSCTMVADGMATAAAPLSCPAPPPAARLTVLERSLAALPPLRVWVPLYLILVNIITFGAFALDRHRATRAMNRVAPAHLLALTFFGGGLGGIMAQWRLDHLRHEQPFADQFGVLIGLQFGAVLGIIGLWLAG
jgi:uncharacterized membrane protein YsdA (DUF1294 family)